MWAGYGTNGKEETTLADALTHSTGLAHHVPKAVTSAMMCDHDVMESYLARCNPMHPVGQRISYHYYNYGWIVGGILRRMHATAARGGIRKGGVLPSAGEVLRDGLLKHVGGHAANEELFLGVPQELLDGGAPSLARLCGDFGVTSRAVGSDTDSSGSRDGAGSKSTADAKMKASSSSSGSESEGVSPDGGGGDEEAPGASLFGQGGGGGGGGGLGGGGMGKGGLMGLIQMA